MKVKVFYPNKNNKIEFTREELEKLLDEVYEDGYDDGKKSVWTYSPSIAYTNHGNNGLYYTTSTACSSDDICINDSNTTTADVKLS